MPIVECPSRSLAIFGGQGQENIAWEIVDDARKVARGEADDPSILPVLSEVAGMDEDGRGYHLPLQWPYLNKEPGRLGYGVVVGWRSGLLTGSQPANISMVMIERKGPTASRGTSVGGRASQHVDVLTR